MTDTPIIDRVAQAIFGRDYINLDIGDRAFLWSWINVNDTIDEFVKKRIVEIALTPTNR